jgi:2-oxoglutarate dehydrogenase E2 component (dihydrolipoamide succinyltransferase)
LVGKDGDYVEKDQAIAEVDSDKATLNYLRSSGIITLTEEGDAVAVGAVVCLTQKELNQKVLISQKVLLQKQLQLLKRQKRLQPSSSSSSTSSGCTYASGTPSPAARKILDEKIYLLQLKEQERRNY